MSERKNIVELWQRRLGGHSVLVTLVHAEGSSYRRPGARMLISSGLHAGTLSGGCLEAEVVQKASWIIRQGPKIERYSMLFDDTADVPFGLGCGGTVDLLFESTASPEARALLEAMSRSLAGEAFTVVTFFAGGSRALRRLITDAAGDIIFRSRSLSDEKIACARSLSPGQSYDGRFVEALHPPQRLFVLGAGDDAQPVVELAASVGFAVTVADGRPQFARPDRFPKAQRVLALDPARPALDITAADAVVIMTHSYEQDRALLVATLPLAPRYLGLLGARHRSSLLVSEAANILNRSLAECCERLFAPVGMDLGGDGPEAIALAIVAEIHGVVHGRLGSSLRLSADDVAQQVQAGGATRYLQAQCLLQAQT